VDHVRPWSTVDRGSAAESVAAHRRYGSPAVATRGGGGTGGCGSAEGALTGDGAAVKRPGDGVKAAAMKGHGARERRKGGRCGERRGEVRPGCLL
jgi:hypothetical protein